MEVVQAGCIATDFAYVDEPFAVRILFILVWVLFVAGFSVVVDAGVVFFLGDIVDNREVQWQDIKHPLKAVF